MAEQLVLIDEERTVTRLDERTREVGRRGVAKARRALAEALRQAGAASDRASAA